MLPHMEDTVSRSEPPHSIFFPPSYPLRIYSPADSNRPSCPISNRRSSSLSRAWSSSSRGEEAVSTDKPTPTFTYPSLKQFRPGPDHGLRSGHQRRIQDLHPGPS